MPVRDVVLDAFAALGYKRALKQPKHVIPGSWVPDDQLRRLAAYKVRAAYTANSAREYLPEGISVEDRDSHREYGDAALLVRRVVSGVMGESVEVVVDGADDDLPDAPRLPEEPDEPGEDASDLDRRVYQSRRRVWQERAEQAITEWEQAWDNQPVLQAHQEWLRGWADDELLEQRIWEAEQQAVGLGDAVYVLGLSSVARRPKLRIYDPGFYFPVLDELAEARGFPTKVHIAYEEDVDGDGTVDHVRRITYELGPIMPSLDEGGMPVFDDNGLRLGEGDRLVENTIVRRYAWSEEDSATTCYLTDARWRIENIEDRKVLDLDERRAEYLVNEDGVQLRRLDLRIDFLPVLHVPNTPASQEHFGTSILDGVSQVFDDLSETDSDLQKASALAGIPMLGITGNPPDTLKVAPGSFIKLGPDGKLFPVDMSQAVVVLRDVVNDLLDRLSTNAQVPSVVLGRTDPAKIASGILYALTQSPFAQLIGVLRLVREPKYALLLKHAARMAQAGKYLEPGDLPPARLVFGSFLPQDRKAGIDEVVALLQAKGISRLTSLRLLVALGIEIGDVAEELDQIQAEDFEGAAALLDALGDEQAVADYLGRKIENPNPPAPPEIDLPVPPGAERE